MELVFTLARPDRAVGATKKNILKKYLTASRRYDIIELVDRFNIDAANRPKKNNAVRC